jgi:protein TonB
MFEDSTFESTGRIHTRSRAWMIAALAFNSSILLTMVLIPLIAPEALPPAALAFLMEAPVPPSAPTPLAHPLAQTPSTTPTTTDPFQAPRVIPPTIPNSNAPEPPTIAGYFPPDPNAVVGGVPSTTPFNRSEALRVVAPENKAPVHLSSSAEEALLIRKTMPVYPPIAKAARVEGMVALMATISKSGTIENLRVVSGPPLLRQAAIDAVATWLYKPYVLDNQPVEVQTTVNVNFTLSR